MELTSKDEAMIRLLLSCYLLMMCWSTATQAAEPMLVRYNLSIQFVDPKQSYYIDLLRLAMEKSRSQYGDYQLEPVTMEMPQVRTIKLVEQQQLDVVWTMTSKTREQTLSAIYFPLLKGLMGHRIAIVRAEDKQKFADINSVEQLKRLIVGQGTDWPDSDILQQQGFTLVRGAAKNLIAMLNKARFDYFLRALHEPWDEVVGHPELIVDESFMVTYPSPIYFFVNRDNTLLAERIEHGLRAALVDGSFDDLFYHHAITADMLQRANLPNRRVFKLDNPLLSDSSKNLLSERSLWFD
ncbi:hypothetical protein BEL05_07240 [Shewanella colwelliana]|uniref:Solute-binding protein family 3/N-terminal domain-containing protein n=2 Tax=Shewanella colwelliana TaxID=23 RepID=A0A1E5IY03_SHECO|nr:hypothetical protein BEL05_07240 [Shewanella colwelliana]